MHFSFIMTQRRNISRDRKNPFPYMWFDSNAEGINSLMRVKLYPKQEWERKTKKKKKKKKRHAKLVYCCAR